MPAGKADHRFWRAATPGCARRFDDRGASGCTGPVNPSPNLFLIGPMGAGKSSVGRRLARRFGLPCADLDARIEEHTGASVATIFEIEGEAGFRRRETAMLAELVRQRGIVLATGGGAVLSADNRALLQAHGFVVWLDTSVEAQLQRLVHDRQRPLLEHVSDRRTRLQQLAAVRDPLYRAVADLTINGNAQETCSQAAARIAAVLEQRWQRVAVTSSP